MKQRLIEIDGELGSLSFRDVEGVVEARVRLPGAEAEAEHRLEYREVSPGVYSLLAENGASFEAHLFERPGSGWVVEILGQQVTVAVSDPREAGLRRKTSGPAGQQRVPSPMPGKVVRVLVSEGDAVQAGQGLVVVEAMKMQNELKAPKAGRVISLAATPGASVAAGQVLVTLE